MIYYKYHLSWYNGEEEQETEFWLPKGDNPNLHVGALLNLVELSAHDDGCRYDLKKIGEVSCD